LNDGLDGFCNVPLDNVDQNGAELAGAPFPAPLIASDTSIKPQLEPLELFEGICN
jgi:hypothetical protein